MLARRLGSALCALIVVAGILFGLFLIVPSVMRWERYVIVSGSMTGTYDRGSLVFDEIVPVKTLKVGDVITYRPPPGSGPEGLVTHRIRSIGRDPKTCGRVFRTKGDANAVADPWTFTLPDRTQARVVTGAPYVGFVLAALAQRKFRMVLVGVPALLIALIVLGGLWRDTGREARERSATVAVAES
jgi:signal peptidase I